MRAILAALVWVAAFGAAAETVTVRSGEHDGFSRLVLRLAEPSAWQFGRTLDGYALRVGRAGVAFDLSQVFDRIPRLRLASLAPGTTDSTLTLQLNCACYASAFAFRPDILVIDIRPGPPPTDSPFERQLEGAAPLPSPVPANVPARLPRPDPRQRVEMPIYDWRSNAPAVPPQFATAAEPATPPPPPAPAAPKPQLAALQDQLAREIGRAAAQGLLTPDPAAFADDPPTPPQPPDAGDPAPAGPTSAPDGPEPARMTAQTALDRALDSDRKPATTETGAACIPDSQLDLRSWGDDRPAADQIAARRQALVGEFDRPSPDAVVDMMRLYLFLGFGAEARALPAAMQVSVPETQLLSALADIIDRGRASDPGPLRGQADCDGAVALWAVLADPRIAPGTMVNTPAVLRSFSALPAPLRRLLGPGLASRLLDRNETDAARAVRDAVTRAAAEPDPEVDLLGARVDLAQGKSEAAAQAITRVAQADSPATPDALVLLVETQVDTGTPLAPALTESIAALQREFRGSVTGRNLARAHLLALGLAGDFDAAFDELSVLRAQSQASNTGAAALWQLLADHGSDEMVLRHALDPKAAPEATRRVHTVLARRLIELGFPEAGLAWLQPLYPPTEAEQTLAARADLARGAPDAAAARLAGLSGKEAERLRAEAAAAQGDHSAAAAAFAAADAPDRAGLEAWRAGAWDSAATLAPEAYRAAASLALPQPDEAGAAPPGPLAAGRALVEQTERTRAALEQALAATEVPAASP